MITKVNTIAKVHSQYRSGELTPIELVDQSLAVIDERDAEIRAWVSIDSDGARKLAEEQTQQLNNGLRKLPPLFGIPLGIKDIFDVQGWPTQAGSSLRRDHVATSDAPVVARLREAGAIFLGKTVTTQWASFDPSKTHNPWKLDHTPGGSSSGSAAAVATGMCIAALGSQTGGSIVRPASFCGCIGFKPDYGRASLDGVVPLAPSLDHVGGMARCVSDVAILASVWLGDTSLAKLEDKASPIRFGVLRDFFIDEADQESKAIFDAVFVHLENQLGSVEVVELPVAIPDIAASHRTIMATECAAYHRENFAAFPETYGPWVSQLIREGLATSPETYQAAREQAVRFRRLAATLLSEVDVLAMPSTKGPAPSIDTTGDSRWQAPWSLSGLPTVTIPCGLASLNLPLGLQLVGNDDRKLLGIAAQCERELDLIEEFDRLLN